MNQVNKININRKNTIFENGILLIILILYSIDIWLKSSDFRLNPAYFLGELMRPLVLAIIIYFLCLLVCFIWFLMIRHKGIKWFDIHPTSKIVVITIIFGLIIEVATPSMGNMQRHQATQQLKHTIQLMANNSEIKELSEGNDNTNNDEESRIINKINHIIIKLGKKYKERRQALAKEQFYLNAQLGKSLNPNSLVMPNGLMNARKIIKEYGDQVKNFLNLSTNYYNDFYEQMQSEKNNKMFWHLFSNIYAINMKNIKSLGETRMQIVAVLSSTIDLIQRNINRISITNNILKFQDKPAQNVYEELSKKFDLLEKQEEEIVNVMEKRQKSAYKRLLNS